MKKIRDDIINKARREAEKNVNIFYEDIAKIEVKNSHAKVFIKSKYDEKGEYQPLHLINGDRISMVHNMIDSYGVIVFATAPGRYSEAIGVLVRKGDFTDSPNEAIDRQPGLGM